MQQNRSIKIEDICFISVTEKNTFWSFSGDKIKSLVNSQVGKSRPGGQMSWIC